MALRNARALGECMRSLLHPPNALMKPHNVLGQCFLNKSDSRKILKTRAREREREREARTMVQSLFAPHTSNTSGEAAKSLRHIFTPAGHSMGLFWQGIIDHHNIHSSNISIIMSYQNLTYCNNINVGFEDGILVGGSEVNKLVKEW